MERLNLVFLKQKIPIQTDEGIASEIHDLLDPIEKIYSFIIYGRYDDEILSGYEVNYRICDEIKFNTYNIDDVVKYFLKAIKNPKGTHIIGYKQPPLDVLMITFDNLIHKLALIQSLKWKRLEFDDLYQICRLTLCRLYNKGYYIHKSLLAKSYENDVLMEMKQFIDEPEFISFEERVECNDDNLTIEDTIRDTDDELKEEEDENLSIQLAIFEEVKDLIIDMIGQRGFEQLFRDYKNKTTSSWSRATMYRISNKLKSDGFTRNQFLKKYGK